MKKILSQDKAAQLLFAELCLSLETEFRIKGFRPDFEDTEFISTTSRDKHGRLQHFSGAFVTPTGLTILPFAIAFGGRGDTDTGLGACATMDTTGKRKQILSYLSILEYMISAGLVKQRLDKYMQLVTQGGRLESRAEITTKWPDFRAAAIKSLPYDVAREFEHEHLAAA